MRPYEQYTLELAGVPVLMVSRGGPARAAMKGTVLFVHGLGARKEANQRELQRFADQGFLAIGLDAARHGARSDPTAAPPPLLATVAETLAGLPRLLDVLEVAGLAHRGRVGLCGVSMGGFVAYSAATSGRFTAVVSLLATPVWRSAAPEEPGHHLDRFFPCALLSQLAGKDHLVNPREVSGFHAQLLPFYAAAPDRLALVVHPESGHFMRENDWGDAMSRAAAWFTTHFDQGSAERT